MAKTNKEISTYQKGIFSEWVSSVFLFLKGYKILDRRYKTKLGEIDLIAKRKDIIVFIEVKYRKDRIVAGHSISRQGRERIQNAARLFLQKNQQYQGFEARFDAILVSRYFYPYHIENAWLI